MFIVTDLKQMIYCPRTFYYNQCLPRIRPRTEKMDAGREAHLNEEGREERRSVAAYGIKAAERHFDVWLESERLGLRGRVDLVLHEPEGRSGVAWPVEYKLSARTGPHWELQLAAYALLLEEQWGVQAERGFLYLIPLRRAESIELTTRLKRRVSATLAQMAKIVAEEAMPEPPTNRARCRDCEFRRFCNDV